MNVFTWARPLRRHPLASIVLLVALVLLALAVPYLWGWHHWSQAKDFLAQGRGRDARQHLAWCRQVWPNNVQVHLLSARAARQIGDFAEAELQLGAAERLEPNGSSELTREWAYHRAALGDLGVVESYLRRAVHDDSEQGTAACAALAEGYLRNYRGPEALAILDIWQEKQPDNLHALSLRGDAWRQADSFGQAIPCYQRVLELDPENDRARRWLALCFLDSGQPAPSLPHWNYLQERYPDDTQVLIGLASCRHRLGETDSARCLLEEVLANHPEEAAALHTLGEIEFQNGRFTEAETFLRRALRVTPRDYKINGLLAQVFQQQGRAAEAETQQEKTRVLEARWKRYHQLAQEMAGRPQDPELLCAMGETLINLGYEDLGYRWLLNAVHLDRHCRRGHALLARWYEEHHDTNRAAYHDSQARTPSATPPPGR